MKQSQLLTVAAAALLAGCYQFTEPQRPALIGQFGGRMLGVAATDTAAHYQFICASGVTGPLRLQDDGTYRASGAVTPVFGWPSPSMDVTAALNGDTLYVLIVTRTRTTDTTYTAAASYQIARGGTPDFAGWYCVAARRGG